jgi:hypothetical protein
LNLGNVYSLLIERNKVKWVEEGRRRGESSCCFWPYPRNIVLAVD